MPSPNVELVYRNVDAFNRRDAATYLAGMAEDVEFTPYEVSVQGGQPYIGHAGIRSWWEETFAALPDLRADIREVRDLGDCAVVSGTLRAHGAASGAPFERPMWLGVEMRDNKAVWWCSFENEADALEAVNQRLAARR